MCKSFMTRDSCGKCKTHILDKRLVENLDIISITRLCAHLLWQPEVGNFHEGAVVLSSSIITCNGGISLDTKNTSNIHNRNICSMLLDNWCSTHKKEKERLSYHYIVQASKRILCTLSVENMRTETLKLEKQVSNLITCNGRCTEITMNKEISACTFTLDKISATAICDGSTLLHILNTIIFTLLSSVNKQFTFDSTRIQVNCDGGLRLNDGYKLSIKPLQDTKNECIKLIKSWCTRNVYNDTKVERMNNIALLCQESDNMNELYRIVSGVYTDF